MFCIDFLHVPLLIPLWGRSQFCEAEAEVDLRSWGYGLRPATASEASLSLWGKLEVEALALSLKLWWRLRPDIASEASLSHKTYLWSNNKFNVLCCNCYHKPCDYQYRIVTKKHEYKHFCRKILKYDTRQGSRSLGALGAALPATLRSGSHFWMAESKTQPVSQWHGELSATCGWFPGGCMV